MKCNKCLFSAQIRGMASHERKHTKLKVVDNIAVIVLDSPGVKVSIMRFIRFLPYLSVNICCFGNNLFIC